jgi:hypothetical protein
MIILDRIKGTAKDLVDPRLLGRPIRLRIDGDSNDPTTWHLVESTSDQGTSDEGLQDVRAIFVEFHGGTPGVIMFNDTDEVEFALQRRSAG